MLGIYVHIPFCEKKCSYCNFYSTAHNSEIEEKFFNALIKEIESYNAKGKEIDSLYFGGGTPSIASTKNIEKIINILSKFFKFNEKIEITIEINPNTINFDKLKSYKKIGINRLSFGVQSFINCELEILERTHDEKTARNAIENSIKANFNNISIDLMLGIPLQTRTSFLETLNIATSYKIDHISLYQLKIEAKTKFHRFPPKNLMSKDEVAKTYLIACEFLEKNKFLQYEISNFSKKGKQSQHNLKYWKLEEYLGFGPSAHSFYNNERFYNKDSIFEYIKNPTNSFKESVDENFEWFILGSRLKEGLKFSDLKKKGFLNNHFNEKFSNLLKEKLVEKNIYSLILTPKGMLVQNSIILFLLRS